MLNLQNQLSLMQQFISTANQSFQLFGLATSASPAAAAAGGRQQQQDPQQQQQALGLQQEIQRNLTRLTGKELAGSGFE